MALPASWADRLRLPLIAAPMTGVSGPELVVAACRNGVIGSFPTHNARGPGQLDRWLTDMGDRLAGEGSPAPLAPNLVVHRTNERLAADLDCLVRHRVELVITSIGSPAPVVGPLHDAGCLVFADVATLRHVERAIEAGVDGLVLLTAGAGGQTGTANPFAFVHAVRRRFAGPIVVAGGVSDGAAILAAQALGADLVYMGTKFIATAESLAADDYRAAIVAAEIDDVQQTSAVSGLPANVLRSWLATAPAADQQVRPPAAFHHKTTLGSVGAWAAGHSVSGVDTVLDVASLVELTRQQYETARKELR